VSDSAERLAQQEGQNLDLGPIELAPIELK